MTFSVTILGSNSAVPSHGRFPTAQVLSYNDKNFLIDCGEGTQMRMNHFHIKRGKIDHIFISHLHGDHYFGLPGLLTSYHLLGRQRPLHLHGPAPLKRILDEMFRASDTVLQYELHFHPIPTSERPTPILETEYMEVYAFPLNHRIPCSGFLFKEAPALRTILPEKLEAYQIPNRAIPDIKKGLNYYTEEGEMIPNSELTLDPAPPRSYAYCTDTSFLPHIADWIKGVDLLYHEATFDKNSEQKAKDTFHSTTTQAAEIAKLAKVEKLMIGHFSAKFTELHPFLEETRECFPNTELAIEGQRFEIPKKARKI